MNPALRQSAAHVFVDSLDAPHLSDEDIHHLRRVLRIRSTDVISLSDGQGRWVTAMLADDDTPRIETAIVAEPRGRAITIGVAIPKGDRPEWIVQKLTELGVATVAFMHCDRSVVHWEGDRGERQLQRLRRIAREAAMQSRLVWIPEVPEVRQFVELARIAGTVMADPDGQRLTSGVRTVLVGPEGGFSPEELASGSSRASLSSNILRVETAAVVSAALLMTAVSASA